MRVYTVEQMRSLERLADESGHSYDAMMDRAGSAVAKAVSDWIPRTVAGDNGKEKARVLVLAGPGNNGGDGLVAGQELAQRGFSVAAYLWKRDADEPRAAAARQAGVSIVRAEGDKEWQLLRRALGRADVVLDALLGTGVSRPIEGELAEILAQVAEARRPENGGGGALAWVQRHGFGEERRPRLVAVDLPSGVDGDTGAVDPATVAADLTVTLAGPKVGMLLPPAADTLGELIVADIGIPAAVVDRVEAAGEFLDPATAARLVPPRRASSHKGTFGKVMIVGGSANYIGAPGLAAEGAGRSGAGLVTLAVPNSIVPILAAKSELTSVTWVFLPHDLGALTPDAIKVLRDQLPKYDALALGMGIGQEEVTRRFIYALLGLTETGEAGGRAPIGFVRTRNQKVESETRIHLPPTVLDADALNALAAAEGEWWRDLPEGHFVLTPHPGEMSRLTGREMGDIQAHRLEVAREQAMTWRQVVVLKGAFTVIAAPDGRVSLSPFATAALATAGTGDVLAGTIAGLLAQGLEPYDAARLGVYLHGLAGTLMADSLPVPVSSDLPGFLEDAWALLRGA